MALIKKFRRSLFGYKRKDVEAFVAIVAEVTTQQQEVINQKVSDIEELNTVVNDFEIENLVLAQDLKVADEKNAKLLMRIAELEKANKALETELDEVSTNYENNIYSLEAQLEEVKKDLDNLHTKPSDCTDYADTLSNDVSEILLGAEIIAAEIIEEAKKVNENIKTQSSNIIDINSVRILEHNEDKQDKVITNSNGFDRDLDDLEAELVNIQEEINRKIDETIRELNNISFIENDSLFLKTVGE